MCIGANNNNQTRFRFNNDNTIRIDSVDAGSYSMALVTTQVFRDLSAWYHIVFAVDTTQSTDTNRVKIYVNGERISPGLFSTETYPSLNYNTHMNTTNISYVGYGDATPVFLFDGYMTEINFIDGQALTPSSFGRTNETTGVWSPIAYAGSYGTNGFYLNFSDNSGVTATTLGKDQAGSNNWTPNNFSVTAGAGNDSLVDTPTPYGTDTGVGGEVRGNYCTANPLDMNPTLVISNGNLNVTETAGAWLNGRCTFGMSSGKWYAESTVTGGLYQVFGIANSLAINTGYSGGSLVGNWAYGNDGSKIVNGVYTYPYGATFTINDVIGMAFDADAGTLTMYKNGVSQGVLVSGLPANTYFPWVAVTGSTVSFNFGQRPFAYTAPSGFKALVTTNLPEPTVVQGNDYFNTTLYTGDGTTNRTITTGLQSDFVWIKRRNDAFGHILFDVIRGAGKTLRSQSTDAESNDGSFYVQQFNSDNFLLGNSDNASNASGGTYVSWVWNAGGSNATNTDGTITSTVRANPTAGFSVVTFTSPTGTGNFSAGHGLGVTPEFVIVKSRDATGVWYVYHKSLATDHYLRLNGTNASATAGVQWGAGMTSSVLGLRASYSTVPGATTVAYAFAAIPGFSAFGSYTGNASTDGPFVYTGFRPAFILTKDASNGSFWWEMVDAKRTPINPASETLYANVADAVYTSGYDKDILSNGFKPRSGNAGHNGSGITYIYAAFAESPFKYSLTR